MNNMTSKELNSKLLKEFPELKNKFAEYTSWQDGIDTGSHLIYEDLFVPYIVNEETITNSMMVQKCFEYIESIFDLNDTYAENVIVVSVLEPLKYNFSNLKFDKYMFSRTKKTFDEIKC